MSTASEVVRASIDKLLAATEPGLEEHRQRCLIRTSGSFVEDLPGDEVVVADFLSSLDWVEVPWDALPTGTGIPEARYFHARTPEGVRAWKNTMSVREAVSRGLALEVRTHKPTTGRTPEDRRKDPNPWGLGIFTEDHVEVKIPAHNIYVIVGADTGIPWCWHPGMPAVPVTAENYIALSEMWHTGHINRDLLDINVHIPQKE